MSLKLFLAKLFLFAVLEAGAICGVPMPPEKIRRLLQLMNETQITWTVRNDDATR